MTSHQPSPLRNWGIALVFHHSSNDSELVVDEMCHSSPVPPRKCTVSLGMLTVREGWEKQTTWNQLGSLIFSLFITNTSMTALPLLFFISIPATFQSRSFFFFFGGGGFSFVTDFGTIPLQITFPLGKRPLLSLQPWPKPLLPSLSFYIPIFLCLWASGTVNRLIHSGGFFCFPN